MRQRVRDTKPDWNVVVLTGTGLVMKAIAALSRLPGFTNLRPSPHGGVAIGNLAAEEGGDAVDALGRAHARDPDAFRHVQRIVPIERVVSYQRDDVTEALCEAMAGEGRRISGKRFYVRCRLRGLEERLEARAVERAIGAYLLDLAKAADTAGEGRHTKVAFDDPEIVVALEVIGRTVGYALHDRRAIDSPLIRPR